MSVDQALFSHSTGCLSTPSLINVSSSVTQLAALFGFFATNHLILLNKVKLFQLTSDGFTRLRKLYGLSLLIAQTAGVCFFFFKLCVFLYANSVFFKMQTLWALLAYCPDCRCE